MTRDKIDVEVRQPSFEWVFADDGSYATYL
jgi:hypothetical protein